MQWIKHVFSKPFAKWLEWWRQRGNEDVTYSYRASMSFDTLGELLKHNKDVTVSCDGIIFVVKAGGRESRSVYLHDALQDVLRKTRRP